MRVVALRYLVVPAIGLFFAAAAWADDDVVVQKPELAVSVVAGSEAEKAAETPRDAFHLLPGFQIERLFTVPKDEFGSWASMTIDPGAVIAAAEGKQGLFRVTPPPIGSDEPTRVERLKVDIPAAQGLLYAFDSLYVTQTAVRAGCCGPATPTETTASTRSSGSRTSPAAATMARMPCGFRPTASGCICSPGTSRPCRSRSKPTRRSGWGPATAQRHATLPAGSKSRIVPNWDEDLLLPRQWDGGGFAVGVLAPGGWIAATDPDRQTVGTAHGRLPQCLRHRPECRWRGVRLRRRHGMGHGRALVSADAGFACHQRSEFGWRSGTGKWPAYYVDSLPEVLNMGPGSPVGVEFGYGAKFPAKYQKAMFCLDWTFGTIYAVSITRRGSELSRYAGNVFVPLSPPLDRRRGRAGWRPVLHDWRTQCAIGVVSRDVRRRRTDGSGRNARRSLRRLAGIAAKGRNVSVVDRQSWSKRRRRSCRSVAMPIGTFATRP